MVISIHLSVYLDVVLSYSLINVSKYCSVDMWPSILALI
jgi:hypothetical protein